MLKSTLALKKSDDLFEKSSMSFGDHLEELRRALIKAAMWLVGGLCVGVPMATTVVDYMQKPLEAALDEFYRKQSIAEMENAGHSKVSKDLAKWMEVNKKRSEVVFIDMERWKLIMENAQEPASELDGTNSPETKPTDSDSTSVDVAEPKGEMEAGSSGKSPAENPTNASKSELTDPSKSGSKRDSAAKANRLIYEADSAGLPTSERLVPYRIFLPIKSQAETFEMQEGMMIWFKAALVVAAIVASPGIFYHIWGFVASGLYPHERRYVYFFLPAAIALFWIGALFAFFFVFQLVVSFLLNFNALMGVGTTPRLNNYMSFALLLPLGFGVSFQLPLVMLIVERLGIVSVETFIKQWRMAIFIIAVVSMVLTPAEVTSMIAMAVPLIFLYFLGIGLCKYMPRSGMVGGAGVDPR